jgi:hypothetical protein
MNRYNYMKDLDLEKKAPKRKRGARGMLCNERDGGRGRPVPGSKLKLKSNLAPHGSKIVNAFCGAIYQSRTHRLPERKEKRTLAFDDHNVVDEQKRGAKDGPLD